jgi:hypothetical protein
MNTTIEHITNHTIKKWGACCLDGRLVVIMGGLHILYGNVKEYKIKL